jgi:hypothetical protein
MKHSVLLCLTAAVLSLTSCMSPYPPGQTAGAVLGGTVGALAGGSIGSRSCRTTEGALIGGVVGALAGSAIGSTTDRRYYAAGYSRPYYGGSTYIQSYSYTPGVYFGGHNHSCYTPSYGCGSFYNAPHSHGCAPRRYCW